MNNMANPQISIIVPVYNVEKYLHKCMDSLVNQTFENIEFIAVNDGSTDSSLGILREYAKRDSRIVVIDKVNEGVSFARNTALKYVIGEYVMFVDSDDWIDLDTCEKVLELVKQYKCDVMMWSYIREFGTVSVPKAIFQQNIIYDEEGVKKNLHRRFVGAIGNELAKPENLDALCTIWGKLYKTSIIKRNNIKFDDIRKIGTYEDGIFNLRLFQYVRKAVFINKYFYHYRKDNETSLTSQYKSLFTERWIVLFDLIEKYIDDHKLDSIYRQALYNRIGVSILGLGLNELSSDKNTYEKIQSIDSIINIMKFKKAYKLLSLQYFPLPWKFFFGCAKYNFPIGVYLLLLAIRKIISR